VNNFSRDSALIGIAWLSRESADASYLISVALPLVLLGIGQGGALARLTAEGVAGVASDDAGAASGVVNVAHQLGSSLGLAVLIVVFAAVGSNVLDARELLAHRISTLLTAGAVVLAFALALVFILIVRPGKVANSGLADTASR
jgi:hypothetical protein